MHTKEDVKDKKKGTIRRIEDVRKNEFYMIMQVLKIVALRGVGQGGGGGDGGDEGGRNNDIGSGGNTQDVELDFEYFYSSNVYWKSAINGNHGGLDRDYVIFRAGWANANIYMLDDYLPDETYRNPQE